jgi:peptidoglycan/xylan/chitin deacetylase (PgdA/CDA1 family)
MPIATGSIIRRGRTRARVVFALASAALMLVTFSGAMAGQQAGARTVTAPSAGPQTQPGTRWSEAELKRAVAAVRVGRRLTPKAWPGGAKVAVCLTFDVDYEASNLVLGDTAPVALSEREYGAKVGLPRILRLLDEHRLPATFFFAAVNAMLHPESVAEILKRGRHEIGVHGWIHENVVALGSEAEERRLLRQAVEYLTKAAGKRPVGYRSPSWAFSPWTMELIGEVGFAYDSSMMGMDEPYELLAEGRPTGIVELPVDWILDDAPYFGRAGSLPSPELIFKTYRDEFDVAYREGTMLMLTFHPYVSGHRSRMVELEKLVTYMQAKPGVWFATAGQVADYAKTQK